MEPKNIWEVEWARWQKLPTLLRQAGLYCTETDEDVYVIKPAAPKDYEPRLPYELVITGVIHGVEVAGLAALNEVGLWLSLQPLVLARPLVLAIGNRRAALQKQRFLERDLNRSFARSETATWEDQRAKVLEKYLGQTEYYLDLHQTTEPCASPFFIFPYKPDSAAFAANLDTRIPIITHWGKPFSADGCCSDEYVQKLGRKGITLELGQNGFHPSHVGVGAITCWRALWLTNQGKRLAPEGESQYFTMAEVKPYPEAGEGALHEGLHNFKAVKKGEELGLWDGKPILASQDGMILFPKYVREPNLPKAKEFYRIIKPVRPDQLGVS